MGGFVTDSPISHFPKAYTMIRKLVQEGKLDEAIHVLARLHSSLETDDNTLTMLQSRLADLDYKRLNNLSEPSEIGIEKNKIADSFLYFYENLEERVNSVFGLKYDVSDFEQQVSLKMMRQYEVKEKLGEGSSAVIFKAVEKTTGKLVAIRALKSIRLAKNEKHKLNTGEDGKVSAKIAAQIKHRNIIEILSSHESDIPFCSVLEYINGVTLDHLLEVGYFPRRDTIAIIRQICDALYYLQNLGYDHKNLRPSKIIIDHELKPVISVFEIFKDMRGYSRLDKILDDLRYSCPEELTLAPEHLDYDKVNQFLMGLLMFEMLTGGPIFKGDNVESVMESRKMFFEKPVHRRGVLKAANLPADLMKIIQKLLEYDPKRRFRNLIELDKELYKLPLESSKEIELVHESYMRCCAKNREFISSFYKRFFSTYAAEGYERRFEKGSASNRTHKKLRVMVLQLIDMDNGAHPDLDRIKHYKGHVGLTKTDYANFLNALRQEVEATDSFWQKDPSIGAAWDNVLSRAIEKL
jgi:serine/threonine protein kinase